MQTRADLELQDRWRLTPLHPSRRRGEWSVDDQRDGDVVLVLEVVEARQSAPALTLLQAQVDFAFDVLSALVEDLSDWQDILTLARHGRVDEARAALNLTRSTSAKILPGPVASALPEPETSEPGRAPPSGQAFLNNLEYIERHREELLGQWVALEDGALIDRDPKLDPLRERLRLAGRLRRGVLVTKVA